MILPRLPLVVPDGSGPLPVPTATLAWTWGDDVLIPVALKHADGSPYPLAGPVALILALKEHEGDPLPLLALSVVITNPTLGEGEFFISRSYRGLLQPGYLTAGIQFEDDNVGVNRRDTVLRPSRVSITEGIADLDQPVNVPTTQQPLSQGPPGSIQTRTQSGVNIASLSGPQTINGVALVAGNAVLLRAQTDPILNGVWQVRAGAWIRPPSFMVGLHAAGQLVVVQEGTLFPDTLWLCSTDGPADVVDTDALTFIEIAGIGAGRAAAIGTLGAVDVEDPAGILGPRRRLTTADVDGSAPRVFIWSAGKTWATLWAEIQAGGEIGIVLIPSTSIVTITGIGPYNLNGLSFLGLGDRSELDFDPGVLVDAGPSISLSFENLLVFGQAPMMTPGGKTVSIYAVRSLLDNFASTSPLFSTSSPDSTIILSQSSIGADAGATSFLHMTAPGARLVFYAQGGGFSSQVPPIFVPGIFTGVAGSSVAIVTDALSQFDVLSAVASPVTTESVVRQFGRLGFPNYATADLPAPSAFRKGQVAFDLTVGFPKVTDGSVWTPFAPELTRLNKFMIASVTTSDGDLAAATAMFLTPAFDGYVIVMVNGVRYRVGDGTKVGVPCYFSADGGTTARAIPAVTVGDLLYWNGSVSGFQLDSSDRIDFDYEAF